jgi:uncharacterized membrane protein YbhN (UPF0104 family)
MTDASREHGTATRNAVFAAPADDPRARRPIDAATLVVAGLVALLMAWSHRRRGDWDTSVLELFADGVPGWIRAIADLVYLLGGVYSVGLVIGIATFGRGRHALVRDLVFAAVASCGAVLAGAYVGGPELPDLFPDLVGRGSYPSYPVVRLAMLVAVVGVAGPFLSVPMRKIGRRLVVAVAASAIVMTYGTLTAVVGGIAIGVAVAAGVHLLFGSGQGIPSRGRIVAALHEAGVPVTDIEYRPAGPAGATIVYGTCDDGSRVHIKVYGRDAADAAFATRLWRATWYRGASGLLVTSRDQLAEHEALAMLSLERAGVPAPVMRAVTRASTGDVLLVSDRVDGTPLSEYDGGDPASDQVIDRIWDALLAMHATGVTHGAIDRTGIVITTTDVFFTSLQSASLVSSTDTERADIAQLVVATALTVGDDRAIAATRRKVGDAELTASLPLMQTAGLPSELERDVHDQDASVKDLRERIAGELEIELPDAAQLRRVSWGGVAMVLLTLVAAYSLITSLTEIGLDTIVDELSSASWAWVVVALTMAQLTNIGEYMSLVGVMGRDAPFGPTMMFRYALSFISLAVPSDAGAIAMNIRYQQKLGVPPAAAVAQGPLLTIFSKGFDLVLLLITAAFVSVSVDVDGFDLGPAMRLILLVVVVAIIAVVVVVAVPSLRARMMPHVREGFEAVKGSVTDPERLRRIVAGTLLQKVLFALTLGASVAAFGAHLPFASAIFVNTAVSLFVGLVPVPGGIGVGEAALTAGLIAVGIPEEAAVAAAITHRMCTSYLPPVFGWWASRWLTERDYL